MTIVSRNINMYSERSCCTIAVRAPIKSHDIGAGELPDTMLLFQIIWPTKKNEIWLLRRHPEHAGWISRVTNDAGGLHSDRPGPPCLYVWDPFGDSLLAKRQRNVALEMCVSFL